MRLKVTSDGTRFGTEVFADDGGGPLLGVQSVSWKLTMAGPPVLVIEVVGSAVDVADAGFKR